MQTEHYHIMAQSSNHTSATTFTQEGKEKAQLCAVHTSTAAFNIKAIQHSFQFYSFIELHHSTSSRISTRYSLKTKYNTCIPAISLYT